MCTWRTKQCGTMKARSRSRRRGLTSMLAMMYLVLFGALAVGFYSSVNTSVQIANNQQHSTRALLAAESGLDFIRYHLANVSLPSDVSNPQVMGELYQDLKAAIDGTANLKPNTISLVGNTIYIPASPDAWVTLDPKFGMAFRLALTESEGNLQVRVSGRAGTTSASAVTTPSGRTIKVDFARADKPTSAFDYAIASKGRINMLSGSVTGYNGVSQSTIATIISARETSPAVSISGGAIGGDISVTAPNLVSVTGGTVAGASGSDIINNHTKYVDQPAFPVFDTSVFQQFITSTYTGGSTLKNARIPKNTNPTFAGGAIIQGVLYVESPNRLTFRGNTIIQGIIVFENAGDPRTNQIDMRGSFNQFPFPSGSEFDRLREISGISIFAPTASMIVSGSVDSTLIGNVMLDSFRNGGSADLTIDKGTLITLNEGNDSSVFDGKTVKFKSVGKNFKPTHGLKYDKRFIPVATTYQELY